MLPDLSRLSLTDASIQNRSAPDGLSDEFKSIALDSGRRTAEGAVIYKFGEGEPIAAHVSQRVGIAKSGDRGLGLFAIEDMKEGDFVCMFTGAWALESDFAAALGEWQRVPNTKKSIRTKLRWSLKSSDICVDAYSASSMTVVPYNDERIKDGKQGTKETFSCAGQTAFQNVLCVPRMVTEYIEQRSGTGETLCSVQFSTVKLPSGVARPLDVGALMNKPDAITRRKRYRLDDTQRHCVFQKALVRLPNAVGTYSLHIALSLRLKKAADAGNELVFDYASTASTTRTDSGLGLKFHAERMYVSLDDGEDFGLRHFLAEGEFVRDNVGVVTRPMVGPPLYFVKCNSLKKHLNMYAPVAVILEGDEVNPDANPATVRNRARSGPIVDAIREMVYHDDRSIEQNEHWMKAHKLQEELEAKAAARPPMQALTIAQIANPNWYEIPIDSEASNDIEPTAPNDDPIPLPPPRKNGKQSASGVRTTKDMLFYRQSLLREVVAREAYAVELVARVYAQRGELSAAYMALFEVREQAKKSHVSVVVKGKELFYKLDVFKSVFYRWLEIDAYGDTAASRIQSAVDAVNVARGGVAYYDRFFPSPGAAASTQQLRWQQYKQTTMESDKQLQTTPENRVLDALRAFNIPDIQFDLYNQNTEESSTNVLLVDASAHNGLRLGAH
jgi:hypothetical protein